MRMPFSECVSECKSYKRYIEILDMFLFPTIYNQYNVAISMHMESYKYGLSTSIDGVECIQHSPSPHILTFGLFTYLCISVGLPTTRRAKNI